MNIYPLGILISILLFSACSPIYYEPNAQNVPMISEKDDLSLSASIEEYQLNIQGAYGITDKIALQANYFNYTYSQSRKAEYFEVGGGYFNSKIDNLNFEFYGLIGQGRLKTQHNFTSGYANGSLRAKVIRYGFQPILAHKSRFFAMAFSTRILMLNYTEIEGDLIYDDVDQIEYLNNRRSHVLIEPAFTLRAGIKNFKLQAQFLYSHNLTHPNFAQENEIITIGAVIDLNIRKNIEDTRRRRNPEYY